MAASKSSRTRTSKPAPVRSSPTHPTAAPVRVSGTTQRSRNSATATQAASARAQSEATAEVSSIAPTWLQWTTFVLAIVALAASSYLTYQHFTAGKSFFGCADKGFINCDAVTTSAQSHFLGIPVALLGLLFYVFMVVVMSPWAWRLAGSATSGRLTLVARWLPTVRLAAICVGICMVLYLLYAELFMIRNLCLYCTSVHVVTFLLFLSVLFAAGMWGLNPYREDY
jgi:uncharacterized membrane protein